MIREWNSGLKLEESAGKRDRIRMEKGLMGQRSRSRSSRPKSYTSIRGPSIGGVEQSGAASSPIPGSSSDEQSRNGSPTRQHSQPIRAGKSNGKERHIRQRKDVSQFTFRVERQQGGSKVSAHGTAAMAGEEPAKHMLHNTRRQQPALPNAKNRENGHAPFCPNLLTHTGYFPRKLA